MRKTSAPKEKRRSPSILEGDIRRILTTLAVPLLLGSLLQQMYGTIDALIVGQLLGAGAFAAVGIAGTVMNLFIFMLNGFCVGVSILFAQLHGAGRIDQFRRAVFTAFSLGMLITGLLGVLFIGLLDPLLKGIRTPEALTGDVRGFLTVIIAGLPAVFFYNLLSGMLRAIGNTRAALMFLLLSVAVNAAVDGLFIGVLQFGVVGAAWATVFAQALSAACCLIHVRRHFRVLLCRREDIGIHPDLIGRTLGLGFASALHQASLYLGKILVQGSVNTLGIAGIAAYTATARIEGFANSFGDSGSQAMSVFISQNFGGGRKHRVNEGLRQGLMLLALMGVALSAVMFLAAEPGLRLFLKPEESQALSYGAEYLRIISVFYVLCFIGNAFVGYFRGIGKMLVPTFGTMLHIGLRVLLSYLLVSRLGLSAVAIATGLGWVLVVTFQAILYRTTRVENRHDSDTGLPHSSGSSMPINSLQAQSAADVGMAGGIHIHRKEATP